MLRYLHIVVMVIFLLHPGVAFSAAGQFVNTEDDCRLFSSDRTNERPCGKEQLIENNDIIETPRDISKLSIQWLSPRLLQTEKIGENAYRVSLKKMQTDSESMKIVADMFSFARKAPLAKNKMVTRSWSERNNIPPGKVATLLSGYDITFTWYGAGTAILRIEDEAREEVINVPLQGKGSATVNPREASLKPGQKYNWTLGDKVSTQSGTITFTPVEYEQEILGILNQIGKSEESPGERVLMQAGFLKFAPEVYSDKLDYRWLIHDLLCGGPPFADGDKDMAASLLQETGMGPCPAR
jgi:hypothetical protein